MAKTMTHLCVCFYWPPEWRGSVWTPPRGSPVVPRGVALWSPGMWPCGPRGMMWPCGPACRWGALGVSCSTARGFLVCRWGARGVSWLCSPSCLSQGTPRPPPRHTGTQTNWRLFSAPSYEASIVLRTSHPGLSHTRCLLLCNHGQFLYYAHGEDTPNHRIQKRIAIKRSQRSKIAPWWGYGPQP